MPVRRLLLCATSDSVCSRVKLALASLPSLLPPDVTYSVKDITHLERPPVTVVPCLVFLVDNKPIHRLEGEDISLERVLKTLKELE